MTSSMLRCLHVTCALCVIAPAAASAQKLVTAPGPGTPSTVRVIDASGADQSFLAYDPAFLGGVRVALGDVNGDGVSDIVTAAGPGGGPHVRVWSGTDLTEIGGFSAYEPTFAGGVFVAAGDVNGDGRADIITGAGAGRSPQVRIWDAATFTEIAGFSANDPAFHGGVTVAAGDVDGDGVADIVTGTGAGGRPRVRVWNGATRAELGGFDAYNPSFHGGVNVAAGDIDGDGLADILTGAGPGGSPQVRVWSGASFTEIGAGFVAYEPGFSGGITVAAVDLDRDGVNEIVTGPMTGSPLVRVWTRRAGGTRFRLSGEYFSFDPGGGLSGAFVASASEDDSDGNLRFVSATETTFAVGSPGTFTVRTKGGPKPALTQSGALPAGVTFVDNGDRTATLAGTPATGSGGTYPLVFIADNGTGTPVTQNFTLIVGQGPAITSANATTFTVGVVGTFTITTTGTPTPAIAATGALPSAVTFTDNGNGTATLAGAPAAGTAGTYPLTITATNSGGSALQNFTLTVQLVCPTITITPTVMPDGFYQTVYAGVDFNQTGSTGSSFTWGATGLPVGLSINTATGVVSGTPTNTVLNAAVAVTVTDNFGCSATLITAITVRPFTDNEIYMGGVGNTQFAVGVTGITTPRVFVNDNVKNDDDGPGTLTVTFPATSANGVIVEGAIDGTFVYTPNLNFAGPSDSFVYTLTDSNGVTNTGTVTINLSNIVWYVNSAGGNGDGRSQSPFNTLASASTASSAGSVIYVHTGGPTTPGNLTMDANQVLHGQGAPFALNALMIAAGARPTLTGTVTLANSTSVTAVNFTPSGIPALVASGVSQPITIDQVDVTGGTTALSLTNVSGAVTVSNANFTNTTAAEVLITQGTGNVSIAATISSNAGRSIDIQNRTGGIVSFTGAITDTGQGIFLNSNTGSTIAFSGGLTLSTGANPGFTATGGGTVSATQNNTTILNTITTTTATALNVANTTIGASGLTFRSISSNGGLSNGIVLDTTGSSGGLTVDGDGANTGVGGNASGGTIGNKSGADGSTADGSGIYLNSTSGVILRRMTINGTNHNFAIRGVHVTGFTMEYSTVTGSNGDSASLDEGSVNFENLTGAAAITSSVIEGGFEDNLKVLNTSGILNRLVITGSTFGFNHTVNGNNNILIESQNAGTTLNFTMQSSTIKGARADWISASNNSMSTMDAVVGGTSSTLGNTFDNLGANAHAGAVAGGNRLALGSIGTMTFDLNNNTLKGSRGEAIRARATAAGTTTGSATGYVRNNVIGIQDTANSGSAEGSGILAIGDGGSDMTIAITGNTVHQYNNHGISMTFGDEINDGSVFNATVTGNTVNTPGNINSEFNAVHLNNGTVAATDNFTSCVDIGGAGALSNVVAGGGSGSTPPTNADIRLRQRQATTVRLPGYGGANNDDAAVVTYLTGRNTLSTAAASNTVPTGGGFIGGGACTLPSF